MASLIQNILLLSVALLLIASTGGLLCAAQEQSLVIRDMPIVAKVSLGAEETDATAQCTLVNNSDRPIRIHNVHPTCPCISFDPSQVVQIQGHATLPMRFSVDLSEVSREMDKTVEIDYHVGSTIIPLILKIRVKPLVELTVESGPSTIWLLNDHQPKIFIIRASKPLKNIECKSNDAGLFNLKIDKITDLEFHLTAKPSADILVDQPLRRTIIELTSTLLSGSQVRGTRMILGVSDGR